MGVGCSNRSSLYYSCYIINYYSVLVKSQTAACLYWIETAKLDELDSPSSSCFDLDPGFWKIGEFRQVFNQGNVRFSICGWCMDFDPNFVIDFANNAVLKSIWHNFELQSGYHSISNVN